MIDKNNQPSVFEIESKQWHWSSRNNSFVNLQFLIYAWNKQKVLITYLPTALSTLRSSVGKQYLLEWENLIWFQFLQDSSLLAANIKQRANHVSKTMSTTDNQQRKLLKTKAFAYLNILRWFNCSWRFCPPSTISFLANPWFSRRCLFVSSLTKRTIAQSGTIIVIMSLWAKFNVNDKKNKRKK